MAITAASPAMARCVPLGDLLPDSSEARAVVFIGTVVDVQRTTTALDVEAWYLGEGPVEHVSVSGGRSPGPRGSEDWHPEVGQSYVVVAERKPSDALLTTVCRQSSPWPELLAALAAAYGDPLEAPFSLPASPAPSAKPSAVPSDAPRFVVMAARRGVRALSTTA